MSEKNAPFGRLSAVRGDRGGYIGMVKDGETYAGFATIDPHGLIWSDHEAYSVAEAVIACWNACADAGLTVAQLDAGVIKQAMQQMVDYDHAYAVASMFALKEAGVDVMATALSRAMDRIVELENALNSSGATGVHERAGEVIAYIVRDRDSKINERYHAAVDSRWRYGTTANGLWCANEDAARIGGTVSAIMTDGEDTWEA